MKPSLFCIALISGVLITSTSVRLRADPLPGEKIKFYQLPLNSGAAVLPPGAYIPDGSAPTGLPGHDELSTAYITGPGTNNYGGTYMADDFCDHHTSPVVHVMWWGSYIGDVYSGGVPRFLIAFESDVPAGASNNPVAYSHPGSNILAQVVTRGPLAPFSGTFTEVPVAIGPGPVNPDGNLYQYNAELTVPFPEQSDQVYWLKIVALSTNSLLQWGWHDRDYGIEDPLACKPPALVPGESNGGVPGFPIWHFQDDAVTGPVKISGIGPLIGIVIQTNWVSTFYIPEYDGIPYSKDLAFALYTTNCPAPPTNPPTKWIEYPNLNGGVDVAPTSTPVILADDFQCAQTGPITDIHIWGMGAFPTVTNFSIGFYSDIPAISNTFSRPGVPLWTTNFLASQYFITSENTNAVGFVYDPNTEELFPGFSSLVRYNFCIDPERAFVQTNGVTYWLVVQAHFGSGDVFANWLSSSAECHDDAVWSVATNVVWQELRYPAVYTLLGHSFAFPLAGQSFDLAFELTTSSLTFDQWQIQYFGSITNIDAAAGGDPDGDGMSNIDEFRASTVPTNSASSFRITSIARTGAGSNDITLTWTTVGGQTYIVQTNRPPASGSYTNNFSDASPALIAPGVGESTMSYIDSNAVMTRPTRYYRVRLVPVTCQ